MSIAEQATITQVKRIPLGRRISEVMREKGEAFSIRKFSSLVEINRESLRLMLSGERRISPSELERIANALEMSVDRLQQHDTYKKEQELDRILTGNTRTKVMLMRAHELASELVEVAVGETEKATSLNNLGRVLFFQQKFDEAHQIWLRAKRFAEQMHENINDNHQIYLVLGNLMLSYTVLKEFSNVEKVLVDVEQVFYDNPEAMGRVYYTRMKVQEERQNLELARKHAYRSLEYFEQTNNNVHLGHALINVAHFEYLLENYKTAARALSTAIKKLQGYDRTLIIAVKDYAKTLMKLKDYTAIIRLVTDYTTLAKEYPDYWGKLQIMYAVASDDPSYAHAVANDSSVSLNVRNFACRCLMEYYVRKDDAESAISYYKMGRIYSNKKSEFLDEEGF